MCLECSAEQSEVSVDTRGIPERERAQRLDYLWRFYDEHAQQARQHETLRASATSMIGATMAAVIALSGIGGLTTFDVLGGLVVVLLGAAGTLVSLKHYERNRFHARVMGEVRKEVDAVLSHAERIPRGTAEVRKHAKNTHDDEYRMLARLRLHLIWASIPALMSVIGVIIIVLSLRAG